MNPSGVSSISIPGHLDLQDLSLRAQVLDEQLSGLERAGFSPQRRSVPLDPALSAYRPETSSHGQIRLADIQLYQAEVAPRCKGKLRTDPVALSKALSTESTQLPQPSKEWAEKMPEWLDGDTRAGITQFAMTASDTLAQEPKLAGVAAFGNTMMALVGLLGDVSDILGAVDDKAEAGRLEERLNGWQKMLTDFRKSSGEMRDAVDQLRKQETEKEEPDPVTQQEIEGMTKLLDTLDRRVDVLSQAMRTPEAVKELAAKLREGANTSLGFTTVDLASNGLNLTSVALGLAQLSTLAAWMGAASSLVTVPVSIYQLVDTTREITARSATEDKTQQALDRHYRPAQLDLRLFRNLEKMVQRGQETDAWRARRKIAAVTLFTAAVGIGSAFAAGSVFLWPLVAVGLVMGLAMLGYGLYKWQQSRSAAEQKTRLQAVMNGDTSSPIAQRLETQESARSWNRMQARGVVVQITNGPEWKGVEAALRGNRDATMAKRQLLRSLEPLQRFGLTRSDLSQDLADVKTLAGLERWKSRLTMQLDKRCATLGRSGERIDEPEWQQAFINEISRMDARGATMREWLFDEVGLNLSERQRFHDAVRQHQDLAGIASELQPHMAMKTRLAAADKLIKRDPAFALSLLVNRLGDGDPEARSMLENLGVEQKVIDWAAKAVTPAERLVAMRHVASALRLQL